MKFKFRTIWFASLSLLLLLLAACSNASSSTTTTSAAEGSHSSETAKQVENTGKTSYPLTIENFTISGEGGEWKPKSQTFEKAPERVVANTQSAAEMLIKLGLTDKIVGVAALYGTVTPDVADDFAKIPVLSKDYVGKELVVGASPDLVLGRGDLFADADWGVGTVDGLNDMNIRTFLQTTNHQGTLDSLYKDIAQLGQIFDVQDNAAKFTESLKARVEAIKSSVADQSEHSFAYIVPATEDTITVSSMQNDTYQLDALSLLKLKNTFDGVQGEVSVEQLITANPDYLLLSAYAGSPDIDKLIQNLYANPALQSMNAIKNKQIYVTDFSQFWGYGYQILDGIEKMEQEMKANPIK
ncbi:MULTISPECIES: ABC transporter substrate-binding protein [Paenibacillus]|uniref:Iron complex transport system substrate-binding protein n=1 Tax=Paenibacillus pabuli TaxID=1472 RepID=A0A855Y3F5_9BACL|nr:MULTISPECIES: ABC transporter substrate-binding protein [Paenibacillus]PWW43258.1 iron complex transport system substrate-binding protein [Paenibacillus pabuli]PXW09164.1 iron complex transport system substrate-binding protein [Paenibacillus taichungensis]